MTPSPSEYTEDYFLTNCGGYKECLQGKIPLRHRKALEYLEVHPGEVILDIGCGRGELLQAYSANGGNTVGFDYSPAAVKLSSNWRDDNVVVIRASATALPFREQVFDRVIMLDLVEHLSQNNLLQCLKDVMRVLKEGGQVLIHTPNQWGDYVSTIFDKVISRLKAPLTGSSTLKSSNYAELQVNVQSPISLRRTLRTAGFKSKIGFAGHPLQHAPYSWVVIDKVLFFISTIWCKARRI